MEIYKIMNTVLLSEISISAANWLHYIESVPSFTHGYCSFNYKWNVYMAHLTLLLGGDFALNPIILSIVPFVKTSSFKSKKKYVFSPYRVLYVRYIIPAGLS